MDPTIILKQTWLRRSWTSIIAWAATLLIAYQFHLIFGLLAHDESAFTPKTILPLVAGVLILLLLTIRSGLLAESKPADDTRKPTGTDGTDGKQES